MSSDQHEQHIGKRRGFEARHVRNNRVRAFGTIAYATGYGKLEEMAAQRDESRLIRDLQGKVARYWVVERRAGEHWISADRGMQGRTLQEAENIVRGMPQYRVRRLYRGRSGN